MTYVKPIKVKTKREYFDDNDTREFIPVGGYVQVGSLRFRCVKMHRRQLWCKVCAFEHTSFCGRWECRDWARKDGESVVFTLKLEV